MNINFISLIRLKKEIISATKKLFIFNPEHDFALAVGNRSYTPPSQVLMLRYRKALLPAKIAGNGDFILFPEYGIINSQKNFYENKGNLNNKEWSSHPFADEAIRKGLKVVNVKELPEVFYEISNIVPWGWDYAIKKSLIENGCPEHLLPTDLQLDKIRELSHRRTTLPFRETISNELKLPLRNQARELFSVKEVEMFLEKNPVTFFKAPWSSSGRGIIVSDHITKKGLLEWAHGLIKRQGSIIAEPAWEKTLDFATEWLIRDKIPIFLGYSVFEASSRGKYHGNKQASQETLLSIIKNAAPDFNKSYIDAQKIALIKHISPFYEGPLGIDMLVDQNGEINPCVEINLRLTMGHLMIPSFCNILI